MDVKKNNNFNKKDDMVLAYLNDIKGSKSQPIKPEDEKALLEMYYTWDLSEDDKTEIRNTIVMSHQRFLYDMAKCYSNGNNSLMLELINVGTLGMYETFDNYDITKDNKFMTYAQYYVRRAINHFMEDESLVVRPTNNAKLTPKVKRIEEEFYRTQGRKPTVFEIEDILFEKYGIELADRNDIYGAKIERIEDVNDCSDDSDYTFEMSKSFTEYASTDNEYETETMRKDTADEVSRAIARLPEREATIIKMAYGLGNYNKPCNNDDIGEVIGLSSERVRQLKKHAENKLRSLLAKFAIICMLFLLPLSMVSCDCCSNNDVEPVKLHPTEITTYKLFFKDNVYKRIDIYKYELPEEYIAMYRSYSTGEIIQIEITPKNKESLREDDKSESVLEKGSYFDY